MQYILDRNESITVNTVLDLPRLKQVLEVLHLNSNYNELSCQLGCDRRTVKTYYEKGEPSKERKRQSQTDSFYDIIETLLSKDILQKFNYLPSHYKAQLQKTIPYLSVDEVKEKARSNLERVRVIYE
ncbi:hypothetical protein [Veillonella sp. 3891]|uniref:hypothetical protein n=1 Tax=Veillonella sp. 3891 TaxID=2490951 RepID=UPI000F8C62FE|nr:hypothetical protein [Veillonella sp. 3891]